MTKKERKKKPPSLTVVKRLSAALARRRVGPCQDVKSVDMHDITAEDGIVTNVVMGTVVVCELGL